GFTSTAYTLGKSVHALKTGKLDPNLSLKDENLALPHRISFDDLKTNVKLFTEGKENEKDLERWTDRMVESTKKRKTMSETSTNSNLLSSDYGKKVDKQVTEVVKKRQRLMDDKKQGTVSFDDKVTQDFLSSLNSLHGNIPDLGPHTTINIPVSNRGHMNIKNDGSMSPGTETLVNMSPHRLKRGIATTSDNTHLVTTEGTAVPILKLPQHILDKLNKHKLSPTTKDQTKM
ncbi:MAG TPA: hypothetical protein VGO69_01885, partial [Pyrinomonadaceae bacterium]|nr:hypothetical protein [Pyrinomonadaceae bacterium]